MYEAFNAISPSILENGCRNLIHHLIRTRTWSFGHALLCSPCFPVGQTYLNDSPSSFCPCSFEAAAYDFGRDICGFRGVIFGTFGMTFVLVVVFDALALVYGLMFVLAMAFDALVQTRSSVDESDIMCFHSESD